MTIPRCDILGNARGTGALAGAAAQKNNRPLERKQSRFLPGRNLAKLARSRHIRHHDRKRLSHSAFALAYASDRGGIGCVRREMKTAQAFDGGNMTFAEER